MAETDCTFHNSPSDHGAELCLLNLRCHRDWLCRIIWEYCQMKNFWKWNLANVALSVLPGMRLTWGRPSTSLDTRYRATADLCNRSHMRRSVKLASPKFWVTKFTTILNFCCTLILNFWRDDQFRYSSIAAKRNFKISKGNTNALEKFPGSVWKPEICCKRSTEGTCQSSRLPKPLLSLKETWGHLFDWTLAVLGLSLSLSQKHKRFLRTSLLWLQT